VPGADLHGVHQAMEYLPLANRAVAAQRASGQDWPVAQPEVVQPAISASGRHVVIIGGGDTGADCLGTALRQGAASVTQLEILPRPPELRPAAQPWPTYPMVYRVTSAHEEGGERVYAVSTREFLADEAGRVRALRLAEVEFAEGSFRPLPGTERDLPCDLVLLAMGFSGAQRGRLVTELGVAFDERGNVARDGDFATSVPGVFVAGDMGRGQSLIVWAIAEGRSAAAGVDRWLMGETALPAPLRPGQLALR
jgi:glutamate synthase (NADPH/NADH) small chain